MSGILPWPTTSFLLAFDVASPRRDRARHRRPFSAAGSMDGSRDTSEGVPRARDPVAGDAFPVDAVSQTGRGMTFGTSGKPSVSGTRLERHDACPVPAKVRVSGGALLPRGKRVGS